MRTFFAMAFASLVVWPAVAYAQSTKTIAATQVEAVTPGVLTLTTGETVCFSSATLLKGTTYAGLPISGTAMTASGAVNPQLKSIRTNNGSVAVFGSPVTSGTTCSVKATQLNIHYATGRKLIPKNHPKKVY